MLAKKKNHILICSGNIIQTTCHELLRNNVYYVEPKQCTMHKNDICKFILNLNAVKM